MATATGGILNHDEIGVLKRRAGGRLLVPLRGPVVYPSITLSGVGGSGSSPKSARP